MRGIPVILALFLIANMANAQQMHPWTPNLYKFQNVPVQNISPELEETSSDTAKAHPEYGILSYDAPCKDCYEVLDKRQPDSRYFVRNGTHGTRFLVQQCKGFLHYWNESGQLVSIDPRLMPDDDQDGIFRAIQQPLPTFANTRDGSVGLQLENGDLMVFNKATTLLSQKEGVVLSSQPISLKYQTQGHDGVRVIEGWPAIDREQIFYKGSVKTNYMVHERPDGLVPGTWLVIKETIELPDNYQLREYDGTSNPDGLWLGEYAVFDSTGIERARIKAVAVYDDKNQPYFESYFGSKLTKTANGYALEIRIKTDWLLAPERAYPVTIDPLVVGTNTHNGSVIGFKFSLGGTPIGVNASCSGVNKNKYCEDSLTVTVPGKSTLTAAFFDYKYYSRIQGCLGSTLGQGHCMLNDAAFYFVGPCGQSPSSSGAWSCDSVVNKPGYCWGDSLPMFQTISCLPPSCPDHVIKFYARNMHCSCNFNPNNCIDACHYTDPGDWRIIIEGQTLESDVTAPGHTSGPVVICPGDTAMLVNVASWGVPGYAYLWSPNGSVNDTIWVSPPVSTTYTCTTFDQCNAISTDLYPVVVKPVPNLSFSTVNATCTGSEDGSATVTASGNLAPYTYTWNTVPAQNTATISNLNPGTYIVTVTGNNDCSSVDTVTVNADNILDVEATATDATCFGLSDGSIALDVVTGQEPLHYAWSNQDTGKVLTGIMAGAYTVTITNNIGCHLEVTSMVDEPAPLVVNAGVDQTILLDESAQLSGTFAPPGVYTYLWSPGLSLSDSTSLDPTATPQETTVYTLTITSVGNTDCKASDAVQIRVLYPGNITIPTAFTPNGDGLNDVFFITSDAEIINLKIFNRWGEVLYSGNQYWDGTFNGKEQPMGTYAYLIDVYFPSDESEATFKGNVTLLR